MATMKMYSRVNKCITCSLFHAETHYMICNSMAKKRNLTLDLRTFRGLSGTSRGVSSLKLRLDGSWDLVVDTSFRRHQWIIVYKAYDEAIVVIVDSGLNVDQKFVYVEAELEMAESGKEVDDDGSDRSVGAVEPKLSAGVCCANFLRVG